MTEHDLQILILSAIPVYAVVIGLEMLMSYVHNKHYYTAGDTATNVYLSTLNFLLDIVMKGVVLLVLGWFYQFRGTAFGRLYNSYAVNDSRGLCPTGWHVPSDAEWTNLVTFLGGDSWAGGALKSTGMLPTVGGWTAPNTNASNSSGFTGLPGGYRVTNGSFFAVSDYGGWWSSTTAGAGQAWARLIWYGNAAVDRVSYDQRFGFSVRCVKD